LTASAAFCPGHASVVARSSQNKKRCLCTWSSDQARSNQNCRRARAGRKCPESSSRLRPFIGGKRFDRIVPDFDFAQCRMRFGPVCPAVRHKVGHRHPMTADDDGLAVLFQAGQQAGKVGFHLVNIHRFHGRQISPVSQPRQRWIGMVWPGGRRTQFVGAGIFSSLPWFPSASL